MLSGCAQWQLQEVFWLPLQGVSCCPEIRCRKNLPQHRLQVSRTSQRKTNWSKMAWRRITGSHQNRHITIYYCSGSDIKSIKISIIEKKMPFYQKAENIAKDIIFPWLKYKILVPSLIAFLKRTASFRGWMSLLINSWLSQKANESKGIFRNKKGNSKDRSFVFTLWFLNK